MTNIKPEKYKMIQPLESKYHSLLRPLSEVEEGQKIVEVYKSYQHLYRQFKTDKNISLAGFSISLVLSVFLFFAMIISIQNVYLIIIAIPLLLISLAYYRSFRRKEILLAAFDGKIVFDRKICDLLVTATENLNKAISYTGGRLRGGIFSGWLGEQKGWEFEQNTTAAKNLVDYVSKQTTGSVTQDFFSNLKTNPKIVEFNNQESIKQTKLRKRIRIDALIFLLFILLLGLWLLFMRNK